MPGLAVQLTNLWSRGSENDLKAWHVASKSGQRPGCRMHCDQATIQKVDSTDMRERTEVAGRNRPRIEQVCAVELQLNDRFGLAQRHNFNDHLGC